jgi:hypothetical protein
MDLKRRKMEPMFTPRLYYLIAGARGLVINSYGFIDTCVISSTRSVEELCIDDVIVDFRSLSKRGFLRVSTEAVSLR